MRHRSKDEVSAGVGSEGESATEGYQGGLSEEELIACIRTLAIEERRVEHLLCRYLADLADQFHVHGRARGALSGFVDVYQAAKCLFGMGVRRTRERIRIGRALRELPNVEEAFMSGDLGFSRVREVTRVAKPEDEQSWLKLATVLPMRDLEQRVANAAETEGYRDKDADKSKEPATLSWKGARLVEVTLTMTAEEWALVERAMEGARAAAARANGDAEGQTEAQASGSLSDGEALAAVARDALARQQAELQPDASDPRRMVVLYECKRCQETKLDTGAGEVVLERADAAAFGCGAKELDLDAEARFVKRGGAIPDALKRAVHLRDRSRCRVPGCGRRRYVEVHHLEFQGEGGVHSRSNCCILCTTHHRKLHEGEIRAEGDAEGELRFFDEHGVELKEIPGVPHWGYFTVTELSKARVRQRRGGLSGGVVTQGGPSGSGEESGGAAMS